MKTPAIDRGLALIKSRIERERLASPKSKSQRLSSNPWNHSNPIIDQMPLPTPLVLEIPQLFTPSRFNGIAALAHSLAQSYNPRRQTQLLRHSLPTPAAAYNSSPSPDQSPLTDSPDTVHTITADPLPLAPLPGLRQRIDQVRIQQKNRSSGALSAASAGCLIIRKHRVRCLRRLGKLRLAVLIDTKRRKLQCLIAWLRYIGEESTKYSL